MIKTGDGSSPTNDPPPDPNLLPKGSRQWQAYENRGEFWYIRFRDADRKAAKKGSRDKSVAKGMAKELENQITGIKMGTLSLEKAGELRAHRIPVQKHVEDFIHNLTAEGRVPGHVDNVRAKLRWLSSETHITQLGQITPELVTGCLATLKAQGRSERTRFHYVAAIKQFTHWLEKNRRTQTDLLKHLGQPNVTERLRPALTPEQTMRLITVTRTAPEHSGMSGVDRSWFYTIAASTGFHRARTTCPAPESFDLAEPSVSLHATVTKNRKAVRQPLPVDLTPALQEWLASKPEGTPIFWPVKQTARMIKLDMETAGITPEPGTCFHSLRHTYISARSRERCLSQGLHGTGPSQQAGPDLQAILSHPSRRPGESRQHAAHSFPHPDHNPSLRGTQRDHIRPRETLSRMAPSGPIKT